MTNKLIENKSKFMRRKKRTNSITKNTTDRPRLVINKSNSYNYAQLIDHNGNVLAQSNDLKIKDGTKSEKAKNVGLKLAEKIKEKGIENIVFDRNGNIYHGRVRQIAEGLREGGLNF